MNKIWIAGVVVALFAGLAVVDGLRPRGEAEGPFKQGVPERVLVLCIDDTGSMQRHLPKMWELTERALDNEFRTGSSTSRVIVAHLSQEKPVALTGTPMQIRQAYPDFARFKSWLAQKPQAASRVYDGIADALAAAAAVPGNPVCTLVVFSDMEDNTGAKPDRLLKALADFGTRKDAAAGFYFVRANPEAWAAAVQARVKHSLVKGEDDLGYELPVRD